MNRDDKMKALDAALTQIEKAYGKGSVMKLGDSGANMNIETVPTGSLSLDIALGLGGVPKGRIVEVYGPESSGKTTVALHMVAVVQIKGKVRAKLEVSPDIDPKELEKMALEAVADRLGGKEPRKVIVKAPKIVSIVPAE